MSLLMRYIMYVLKYRRLYFKMYMLKNKTYFGQLFFNDHMKGNYTHMKGREKK